MEFPENYGPENVEVTVLYVNEYQMYDDGTEIFASWKGDHEELVDFGVWGG